LEKPSDVFSYAQKYFSFFNKLKEQPNFQPLIIVGPSGSGKVQNISLMDLINVKLGKSGKRNFEEISK